MAYFFINISVRDGASAQGELNGFLRSHRILTVERRFVDMGENSFWSFCVDYLESSGSASGSSPSKFGGRDKVDYREVLSAEDFAIFAELRQLRKEIAGLWRHVFNVPEATRAGCGRVESRPSHEIGDAWAR